MKSPTAVIADDEPLLRSQLKSRLAKLWPELAIVHEMENGRDAHAVCDEHQPALFFLDIHMPGVNGLEAARAIGKRAHIVFVTAFDQYAVEAFERGAIDYVLKPFNEQRLALCVERLKERLSGPPPVLDQLVEQLAARLSPKPSDHLRWIKASVGSNVRLIPVEEVLFFQSDEKYTRVVLCDSEALIRKPIKELLDELDPEKFWQVHRATIVNVDHIASVKRGLKDQAEIALKESKETVVVSRAFTHLFKQM
ncbi:LytR/AlgR family response regulator transcription factor [Usitatibacter palustris]|uniref:Transcriptional regulatory protein BtsR n=1 Tax=Usitatibacter palustris TaxID=2732487 RepID=A0A6M4HDV3_9PROT|nr:LytTR family DNA-binding domain-containing protein [Usitatibacter palustris]QJR16784.1 Transcriptional regulatory protein BtsR [Usitatibacter palustris]